MKKVKIYYSIFIVSAAINGYMYGNLQGLTMCKGDKVSWHLSGLGSEGDIHGLYFHGNRFLYRGTRRDTINVFPHVSHTVIMEPDSMGAHSHFILLSFNRASAFSDGATKC